MRESGFRGAKGGTIAPIWGGWGDSGAVKDRGRKGSLLGDEGREEEHPRERETRPPLRHPEPYHKILGVSRE